MPTRTADAHEGGPKATDRLRIPIVDEDVFYAEALRCLLQRAA